MAGYREQEWEITYAIKRSEWEIMLYEDQENLDTKESENEECRIRPIEASFNCLGCVFFEVSVAYGL